MVKPGLGRPPAAQPSPAPAAGLGAHRLRHQRCARSGTIESSMAGQRDHFRVRPGRAKPRENTWAGRAPSWDIQSTPPPPPIQGRPKFSRGGSLLLTSCFRPSFQPGHPWQLRESLPRGALSRPLPLENLSLLMPGIGVWHLPPLLGAEPHGCKGHLANSLGYFKPCVTERGEEKGCPPGSAHCCFRLSDSCFPAFASALCLQQWEQR